MKQPQGFVVEGHEDKVYKVEKGIVRIEICL